MEIRSWDDDTERTQKKIFRIIVFVSKPMLPLAIVLSGQKYRYKKTILRMPVLYVDKHLINYNIH